MRIFEVMQALIGLILMRLFPDLLSRLTRLDEIRDKAIDVEIRYRMFGNTNFGATGDQLLLCHFALALEYEQLRYWWMKPLKPIAR